MKLQRILPFTIIPVLMACLTLSGGELPNIILMMGDDHGWDEVGYNGHPYLQTPVLDEMAATGLRLDRFYSAHPTCSPTRGSFLTGRHPNRYGTFSPNWSIRPEEITIGHLLKEAGYRTGHFGKWHVGPVKEASPTSPGAMGFDEWLSHDNFFELDPVLVRNGGPPRKYPGESSEILVRETIRFIKDARARNQPFLAVVWFGSPHEPYMGLPEDLALYDDLPPKYAEGTVRLTSLETGRPTERPLGEVIRERYAEITAMDRAIGQLRDYLAEAGMRDNTLVFYCGDNGVPSSGDGVVNSFRAAKGSVYEGGVRVPGVLEWPAKIRTARHSPFNATTSDLLPTLCELTGRPLPDRPIDGVSLVPVIQGKAGSRAAPVFFWQYDLGSETSVERQPYIEPGKQEGTTPLVKMLDGKYTRSFTNFHHPEIHESDYGGSRAALSGNVKLVISGEGDGRIELFDLQSDPTESHNLAREQPDTARTLKEALYRWQNSVLHSLTGADYE